jgi:hypothetical protein
MERNYQETYEADCFRQVLAKALVFEPDVTTCFYTKEDKESEETKNCLNLIGQR